MTENKAIEILGYFEKWNSADRWLYHDEMKEFVECCSKAIKEVQKYREMDRKLRKTYGECDGLLESVVERFCIHSDIDIGNPIKSRLLTDDDVDKWDTYREIGTIEACREAMDKWKMIKVSDMSAIEYLDTKARMLKSSPGTGCAISCNECPLYENNRAHSEVSCVYFETSYPEEAVAIVEKWLSEHPAKTRQSEFLKLFPNAKMSYGMIALCPLEIDTKLKNACSKPCEICKEKYWLSEV